MSAAKLSSGDTCYYISKNGRKLRCLVVDTLDLRTRKEELLVPVIRNIKRKARCNIDHPHDRIEPQKIKWIKRSELRKLPTQ